jgi:hypothetical protein
MTNENEVNVEVEVAEEELVVSSNQPKSVCESCEG